MAGTLKKYIQNSLRKKIYFISENQSPMGHGFGILEMEVKGQRV